MTLTILALAWLTRTHVTWAMGILGGITLLLVFFFLLRRRWDQAKALAKNPLAKYIALSVVAHLILAIAAYFARVVEPHDPGWGGPVVIVELSDDGGTDLTTQPQPWAPPITPTGAENSPQPMPTEVEFPVTERPEVPPEFDARVDSLTQLSPELAQVPNADAKSEALSAQEDNPLPSIADAERPLQESDTRDPSPLRPSLSQPLPTNSRPFQAVTSQWRKPGESRTPVTTPHPPRRDNGSPLPSIYRDRWDKDRLQLARARGGSRETEAAVQQSLKWLAAAQNRDGRWDASRYGSGQPSPAGQDRQRAGREADSGVTGLAILSFLGAGHTHHDGSYQDTLRNGLDYLLRTQQSRPDGSLVGSASGYAAMYCHGIATLALSEAYGLTGDTALRGPLRRAVTFTLAAQHPVTGGWRYLPRQPGDTSQLGWQLMALTSAHYAGESIPSSTWSGAGRFLNSVSWGRFGGLASYRPGERPSTPMTAEALLCRLLLQTPADHPLVREAADYLVRDLPGQGRVNFYYWYYGTLALYHLQDNHWDVWNRAVKRQLVRRQRKHETLAGSWDPNSVYGASGGRVYTTALATLTLEVYYRYRPLAEPVPEQTAWRMR